MFVEKVQFCAFAAGSILRTVTFDLKAFSQQTKQKMLERGR